MNLYNLFKKNIYKKKYLIFDEKKISFNEFYKLVNYISNKKIFNNKEKIAVCLNNQFFLSIMLLLASKLNLKIFILNPNLSNTQFIQQIKFFGSGILIIDNGVLIDKKILNKYKLHHVNIENYKSLTAQKKRKKNISDNNKDYIITFSSGTTSNPKPIVFSQKIKFERFKQIKKIFSVSKNDNILSTSPLDHSLGQRMFLLSILNGSNFVYFSKYNSDSLKSIIKKNKITFTILPSNYLSLISKYLNKGNLKIKKIVTAASALTIYDKKKIIKTGSNFYEMYGASEIGTVTSINFKKNLSKIKSVGKVIKENEIKILGKNNNILPNGEVGEIICKAPLKFKYYYKKPLLTKKSYHKSFFKTGDLGYLDKNNFLFFVSRKQDVIISGGKNIYPIDIEKELNKIKFIKEAAVIGIKDKYFGEVAFAVCVKEKNIKIDPRKKIRKILIKKLNIYQIPLGYDFIKKLPKNSLGKVLKNKLRKKYFGKNIDLTKNLRKILN